MREKRYKNLFYIYFQDFYDTSFTPTSGTAKGTLFDVKENLNFKYVKVSNNFR